MNNFNQQQLKDLVRPMFCSTIKFGYATPEEVEKMLDQVFFVSEKEISKGIAEIDRKE